MLFLIEKHTDTLFQKTKTKPEGTLEFKINKQMETFSFKPPISLFEEGKWLLAETSFEVTNSVLNITAENYSFSISAPSYWTPEGGEELINKLNELLELRSQNDVELHVEKIERRGTRIEIKNRTCNFAGFGHFK